MTEMILGTARSDRLNTSEFHKLLDESYSRGIRIFDTAPSYGNSEERIASWMKSNNLGQGVKVTTKLGGDELVNSISLAKAIRRLQDLFDLNSLQSLFIHSIPLHEIGNSTLNELISLRNSGELTNLGFSGDNHDLETAVKIGVFDSVMCTNSPIDNQSLRILDLNNFEGEIYAKRVMANYAWSKKNHFKQKYLMRHNWVIEEYRNRIERYMTETSRRHLPAEFMRYALVGTRINYSIFGISSRRHLHKLIKLRDQQLHESTQVKVYGTVTEIAIT